MERVLCPDKLDADPNSPSAEKEYKYWQKTFDNFIDEGGEQAPDRFRCLTKYVSASVHENFANAANFDEAILACIRQNLCETEKCDRPIF